MLRYQRIQAAAQVIEPADQCLGPLLHILAGNGEGQQKLHYLIVGQAFEAVRQEALAQPFTVTVIVRFRNAHWQDLLLLKKGWK